MSYGLELAKRNEFSQYGEDGIIEAIFDRIGTITRWCLEVGAADGIWLSNTRRLYESGWTCVLIESDERKYADLIKNAPNAICVKAAIEPTGPNSIDAILTKLHAPTNLDLVCIDIDGEDYEVFRNLTEHRPRVVVVEHAYLGSDVRLGQVSKELMAELAERKQYSVVAQTECNTICVSRHLLKLLEK
jgi:hypothetical protein